MLALILALWTAISAATVTARGNTGRIVDVGYARYRAHYNDTLDINEFLGIPYAAPPVGQLRWRAPQPYAHPSNQSETIIDTKPGSQCVQGFPVWTVPNATATGSEDCLILDIYTPGNATNAKLPVYFSIHGGGYTVGNTSIISPYALMRHAKGTFIFVNIQYRLGAYGFVGSRKYAEQGGAPNVGLLDQRFAMEWVQKNIAAFGGDPTKVTIQGGSAGGGSVTSHMIWKGGVESPPFRAAIADYPWWQQYLREEQLEHQFDYLLSGTNCSTLSCLRAVPEAELKVATQASYVRSYRDGAYGYGSFYYGPYVDGYFLQDLPSREFRSGHFSKIPTIVSREGLEGVSFTNQSMRTVKEETEDMKKHFPYAENDFIKKIYELYPIQDYNSTFWRRQAWFGDFSIDCPTYFAASSIASSGTPVFKQVFDAGAKIHGSTLPYLGVLDPSNDPSVNLTLAAVMKDWMVSFVVHQDPNAQRWSSTSGPEWPDYNTGDVMSITDTNYGPLDDSYYDDSSRCRFFWANEDIVQN